MEIIACKFGGTSTADADMFRQIGRILDSDARRRFIVLSAPGGAERVTDMLYRCHRAARSGGDTAPLMDAVAERFGAMGDALGVPGMAALARSELTGAMLGPEARAVSRGEYLCARLFAAWRGLPFADAADILRFDASGRLRVPETLACFRSLARRCPSAVIPGFYGADPQGHIVTLPRNGSDITGALCAAGVGAIVYENWSDVPGLMTADPARDPHARVIPEISYARMRRLAESGVPVLHPDSMSPVENAGIPTRLRCTLRPEAAGTLITG